MGWLSGLLALGATIGVTSCHWSSNKAIAAQQVLAVGIRFLLVVACPWQRAVWRHKKCGESFLGLRSSNNRWAVE